MTASPLTSRASMSADYVRAIAEELVDAFLKLEPGCSEEGMLELTREYLCAAFHSRTQKT